MSSRGQGATPLTRERTFDPPFTIGVISDTHIYAHGSRELHPAIRRFFARAGVDLLVHLGDVNTRYVLEELGEIAPVVAVSGNNDDDELQVILPQTTRFTVGNFSFGVIHGHGGRSARDEAIRRWVGKVDCVLFGHSHKPLIEKIDDTILFNPGSATERRWHPHFGVGLIHVTSGAITPDLVVFTRPDHLDNVAVGPEHESGENTRAPLAGKDDLNGSTT